MNIEEARKYNPELGNQLSDFYNEAKKAAETGANVKVLPDGSIYTWKSDVATAVDLEPKYRSSAVADMLGISRQDMHNWISRFEVQPTRIVPEGSREARIRFTDDEVETLKEIAILKRQAISLEEAFKIERNKARYEDLGRKVKAEMFRWVTTGEPEAWVDLITFFAQSPSLKEEESNALSMRYTGHTAIDIVKQLDLQSESQANRLIQSAESKVGQDMLFILYGSPIIKQEDIFV